MKNILTRLLKGTALLILIGILAIIALVILLLSKCTQSDDPSDYIVIAPTPSEVVKIMPKHELYVATAVIEDFTTLQKTEYHLSLFPEKHSCVQILRQKVGFKIDMSEVEYTPLDDNIYEVKMPPLEYVAVTQSSPFISDDEAYWRKALPSTNQLKTQVSQQIRQQFDTKANRHKALLYAEESINQIFRELGVEVRFVEQLNWSLN